MLRLCLRGPWSACGFMLLRLCPACCIRTLNKTCTPEGTVTEQQAHQSKSFRPLLCFQLLLCCACMLRAGCLTINARVSACRELEAVRTHRAAHRSRRQDAPIPVAALVGYTNAGAWVGGWVVFVCWHLARVRCRRVVVWLRRCVGGCWLPLAPCALQGIGWVRRRTRLCVCC